MRTQRYPILIAVSDSRGTVVAMPITADKVRELAARGERSTLDYKRDDYDVSSTPGQNELVKDIMAMVNALGPTAEPAYILVGVEDDGTIVGVTTPPIPDANLRARLEHYLIRRPHLTHGRVDVDGLAVGVYEIRPGGRPMYPKRDSGTLAQSVAKVRSGSATVTATPDEIQGWLREDDPVRFELQRHELVRSLAEAQPQASIGIYTMQSSSEGAYADFTIVNTGRSPFTIVSARWRGEWLPRAAFNPPDGPGVSYDDAGPNYEPPGGPIEPPAGFMPPNDTARVHVRFTRDQAIDHLQRAGLRHAGWVGNWLAYHLEVTCRTDLGGEATFVGVARQ